MQAAAAFIAASKEVFEAEPVAAPALPGGPGTGEARRTWSWGGWLKPLVAILALAAMVVMTFYEGYKLRTRVPDEARTSSQNLVASAEFGLRGGDRVQGESTVVRVRRDDTIGLHFDFTPSQTCKAYLGELQDEFGRVMLQISIPAERINKEVKFVVPAGKLHSGNYVLNIYGEEVAGLVVAKYAFSIEIAP